MRRAVVSMADQELESVLSQDDEDSVSYQDGEDCSFFCGRNSRFLERTSLLLPGIARVVGALKGVMRADPKPEKSAASAKP